MDAKKCIKIYEKLYSNLDIVFNSKEILIKLSDENFKDLIFNQISILNFLEKEIPASYLLKKTNKEKDVDSKVVAKDFLDKLNTILSSNKSFLNLNFKSESDIEDEVNYLSVYIKNTFKKDLNEFKKTTNSPNNVKAEFVKSNTNFNQSKINSSFVNSGFMNSFSSGYSNNNDPRFFQEQVYVQMAQQKLQQDIVNGTFYIYKNKPKIVPILKKILGFLAVFYGILTVLALILSAVSSSNLVVSRSYLSTLGYKFTDNSTANIVFSNITNSTYIYTIFMDIFVILIAFYFSYRMLIPQKNENIKYSFGWVYILLFFFYIILFASNIATSFYQSYGYINYFYTDGYSINSPNTILIDCYSASVYIQTAAYSLLGLMIILAAVAATLAPKKDTQRIELKLQEYISEIKNATSVNA